MSAMATVTGGRAALHPMPKPPARELLVVVPTQTFYKRTKLWSFSINISHDRNAKQEASPPLLCSSPAPSTPLAEDQEESGSEGSPGGCKACGREVAESGCNGEGRIQGGIATVPGFGWWPIKAYRPCPAFVASGGRYRRTGQSMDEVVSGKGERAKVANDQSSKKK